MNNYLSGRLEKHIHLNDVVNTDFKNLGNADGAKLMTLIFARSQRISSIDQSKCFNTN